ncbi:hypothetical protein EV401DRAFT_932646 [Pisolithus croceorrhizus]|nr:hypothetical protein EV401DRAFT_932646 [Pisolithus croceorrhizus]
MHILLLNHWLLMLSSDVFCTFLPVIQEVMDCSAFRVYVCPWSIHYDWLADPLRFGEVRTQFLVRTGSIIWTDSNHLSEAHCLGT